MRAWKGKKRIAKKLNPRYFTKPWYRETVDYLLNAKPGDIIHACTGYNHRIAKIEVSWMDASNTYWSGGRGAPRVRTRIVHEIQVTDDEGRWHWFPGGGCVSLPETQEAIEEYIRGWDCAEGWETIGKWEFGELGERIHMLRAGMPVVDENGLKLPIVKVE